MIPTPLRVVAGAALLFLSLSARHASGQVCPSGSPQTVAYSDSFGPATPPWASSDLVLPQFDSTFGTLIQATLAVDLSVTDSVGAENLSVQGSCTLSWTIGTSLDVQLAGVALTNPFAEVLVSGTDDLSSYDGTTDLRGSSGFLHTALQSTVQGRATITDPQVLAGVFAGTGYLPISHQGTDWSSHGGAGNLLFIGSDTAIIQATIVYTYCPGPFAPICWGDGSLATACPCNNTGQEGHGCENSGTTGGAKLTATGNVNPDTVVLTSSGELPTSTSIFLQGTTSEVSRVVFGDGVRCVGGTLKRLYVESASAGSVSAPAGGDPSITSRSASLGDPIAPGSPRYYQVYYRDPSASFCQPPQGDAFNVSNAVRVAW